MIFINPNPTIPNVPVSAARSRGTCCRPGRISRSRSFPVRLETAAYSSRCPSGAVERCALRRLSRQSARRQRHEQELTDQELLVGQNTSGIRRGHRRPRWRTRKKGGRGSSSPTGFGAQRGRVGRLGSRAQTAESAGHGPACGRCRSTNRCESQSSSFRHRRAVRKSWDGAQPQARAMADRAGYVPRLRGRPRSTVRVAGNLIPDTPRGRPRSKLRFSVIKRPVDPNQPAVDAGIKWDGRLSTRRKTPSAMGISRRDDGGAKRHRDSTS